MRCFTALRFNPGPGLALDDWLSESRSRFPELAVVPTRNLHVTLVFLGELDPRRVDAASAAVAAAASGVVDFSFDWGAAGAFPTASRPRVLWWGVADGAAAMARVQARLVEELGVAGRLSGSGPVAPDARPFRPHVTLARVRHPPLSAARGLLLSDWLLGAPVLPDATATGIGFYSSVLGSGAAQHSLVSEAAFARSTR